MSRSLVQYREFQKNSTPERLFLTGFCVAYTTCVATLWHDRIYLFICTRKSTACHVV